MTPNEEFVAIVKRLGWSQAEAARRLDITPGAVSQIVNKLVTPRPGLMNNLRRIAAHAAPDIITTSGVTLSLREDVVEYAAKIQELPENQKDLVKRLVDAFVPPTKVETPVNYQRAQRVVKSRTTALADSARKRAKRGPRPPVSEPSTTSPRHPGTSPDDATTPASASHNSRGT